MMFQKLNEVFTISVLNYYGQFLIRILLEITW